MKGFATLAGCNSTVGHGADKGTCPRTLPSSSQSYRNFTWVSVPPFFPTKYIRDPLESGECCTGVWPSLRAASAGWVRQPPRGKQQEVSFTFSQPHTRSFLLSLEGTAL